MPRSDVAPTDDAGGADDATPSDDAGASDDAGSSPDSGLACAPERQCGAMGAECCDENAACLGDRCVVLGGTCVVTEECDIGEICEPTLGRCVPRTAVHVCEYRPPVAEFAPVQACRWRPPASEDRDDPDGYFNDVVMTPAVANLTDDNGDGKTDAFDIPDIAFVSFAGERDGCCNGRGRIRIVSGACNLDGTMTTLSTISAPFVDNSSGLAIGNLDPDGLADERAPEIVVTFQHTGTIAFKRVSPDGKRWEPFWTNPEYPTTAHSSAGAQPSLADLDRDGAPEVIVGNVVLNGQTGALLWDGRVTVGQEAGIGNNAFLGPSSTVADIDLDGWLDVIAGNTVYDGRTGAEKWTHVYVGDNSACGGNLRCDGFNAVGNFDADREAEVVIVRLGEVFVLEHDGTEKYRARIPVDDCATSTGSTGRPLNESGPPTVADFDGDGRPEVGTASSDFYVVVDFDCVRNPSGALPVECDSENILWKVPNHDCSSRATGSSVFDFEGDGAAEVVYADEVSFRIFDGRTGRILYEDDTHRSNTRMEMPIVVDVDNDGKSEVVIPEPNYRDATEPNKGGIDILEDRENNWVRTRRIWNQHAYHVTNVTEDGQIPRDEPPNWLNGRLNNFRQNVQPDGLFDAPDLVVVSIDLLACVPGGTMTFGVTIRNQGALGVAAGVPVYVSAETSSGVVDVGVFRTGGPILPGRTERVEFTVEAPGSSTVTASVTVDDDGTGHGAYNECDEANNAAISAAFATCDV